MKGLNRASRPIPDPTPPKIRGMNPAAQQLYDAKIDGRMERIEKYSLASHLRPKTFKRYVSMARLRENKSERMEVTNTGSTLR